MSDNVFNPEGESAIRSRAYADRLAQTGQCPKCGRPVSATAPEGLCPYCLLRSVVGQRPPSPTTDVPPPVPGLNRRVGDYELLQEIGRGGMGVVYKARQTKLGREVALKLMLLGQMAGEKAKERVRHEAQIAARLQHPNIVAVYDVGEHEGAPYIAMEYVEGRTLDQMAKVSAFKPGEAAELIRSLALAIHYAHQQGVVHRDLKPSNVMIDATQRPRITDFGLAKHLESDLGLTVSGETFGTPSFMSPEQAKPKGGQIGPATDVYSLGGILYYLLSGRPPFCADTRDEVLRQAVHDEPVAPRRLNPSIPPDLQTICLKCLDKNPGRRYATAEGLADDLGRFQHKEPIHAKPAHLGTKLRRWCQRQPRVAALLGALLLISALAGFLFLAAMGGVVVNWQRAEQNAKEQKRLREIAEAALRNLEVRAGSYRTNGVFRFKSPPGFTPMAGERLGVLKQALLKNLTVQESRKEIDANVESMRQAMKEGMQKAKQSGFAPSSDQGEMQLVSFYESPSGKEAFGFMTTLNPEPLTFADMELTTKARLDWQMEHSLVDKNSTVESQLLFGQRPTLVLNVRDPSRLAKFTCYIVYIQEQPMYFHSIWLLRFGNNTDHQDEKWTADFLQSLEILTNATR